MNIKNGLEIPISSDPVEKLRRLTQEFKRLDGTEATAWRRYRHACRIAQILSGGAFCAIKILPRWLVKNWLAPFLVPAYEWAAGRSAKDVMSKCGLSDDAIGGACYLYGDYGLPPARAPFLVQAFLETHYDGGGFFPRGGSASIAKTIVSAITRRGGAVMVRANVSEIAVTKQGGGLRATGVVCRGVHLQAKCGVISNAGAFNTYERLLPQAVAEPMLSLLKQTPGAFDPSVALVYLFVGLDGSDQELALPVYN